MKFALCPAYQPDLREHRQPLARADQGKGQWEPKLRLPHILDMLVLAGSDLFYPVCNICLCIQVERKEMKDQQKNTTAIRNW